jgi:hypothetical protein
MAIPSKTVTGHELQSLAVAVTGIRFLGQMALAPRSGIQVPPVLTEIISYPD